jgi:hypothetical protein
MSEEDIIFLGWEVGGTVICGLLGLYNYFMLRRSIKKYKKYDKYEKFLNNADFKKVTEITNQDPSKL